MPLPKSLHLLAAALFWWLPPSHAEPLPQGSITGRVLDPSGAAIARARVAATGPRALASTDTDQRGEFSLHLPAGAYRLTVAAEGFAGAVRSVVVAADTDSLFAIELQLERRTELVTVTEPDAAGYQVTATRSATKTATALADLPQSVTVVSGDLIKDQMMMSIADVVRYVPGITAVQGENNRDQVVIRGNGSSADFFINGVRDDVQYFRDLYNVERVEALKGPNAMIFGRGGGGGVINRVTKEPGFSGFREIDLQGGTLGNRRIAADFDQPFGDKAAVRFNGVYERSDSFRKFVGLERHGLNPAVTLAPGGRTRISMSYENFFDRRTADRGIPSFAGRPADVPISTFFGNPADSRMHARVNFGSAAVEHQAGRLNLRSTIVAADYGKMYQNYVPGAVNADRTLVALSAYNNATHRRNIFNQTDFTCAASTGTFRHTLLWGAELGRQRTENFRNTGYFNGTQTVFTAPYADPLAVAPVVFRQSSTDSDNRVGANVAAGYAQDQIELSRFVRVVAGVRIDRFDLDFHDNRTGKDLRRLDRLVSPRAGVIFRIAAPLSMYGNYGVSWLPSSGDQFSALTTVTQQLKPEKFRNYEAGTKWDFRRLSLTAAAYRLDRTNTRATDPNDPARIIQTGSQRTHGFEFGVNGGITGRWRVAGGYAWQDAFVNRETASAMAGAQVAQVPHHTLSLWNSYRFSPRLSGGLGVLARSGMYAGIDNTVTLPGYLRADAALYYALTEKMRVQINSENVFDRVYFVNANGNNNISPGFPRAIRVGLIARL
jgi:catecholate siderophore receptor